MGVCVHKLINLVVHPTLKERRVKVMLRLKTENFSWETTREKWSESICAEKSMVGPRLLFLKRLLARLAPVWHVGAVWFVLKLPAPLKILGPGVYNRLPWAKTLCRRPSERETMLRKPANGRLTCVFSHYDRAVCSYYIAVKNVP